MAAQPLLGLSNIHKLYGAVHALQGVDFHVRAGEIVGLVGDNGAGKSTLIKIISGVAPCDIGSMTWMGSPVRIRSPQDARTLGIETMHQQATLVDPFRVYENIFLGRWIVRRVLGGLVGFLDHREMRRRATDALSRIGMEIPLDKTAGELSGGQRRALAFAATVHAEPRLLILDEPTASLGINEERAILSIMKSLRQQGLSLIFISHNLEEVFSVCDHLVVLRSGRVVADDDIASFDTEEVTHLMLAGSRRRSSDVRS